MPDSQRFFPGREGPLVHRPPGAACLGAALIGACLAVTGVPAADILLINGNSNNTVQQGNLSIGDAFVKQRLEATLGHKTRVLWDASAAAAMRAAADSSDLVVVLESVTSASLTTKLKATPTPILNCEAFIQDDLGLTAAGPSGDPGPPSQFALGVLEAQTALDIKDAAHPLAAGLSGRVPVYSAPKQVNWGKVAASAKVIATLAGDASGASIYVYARAAVLFDGTQAAGMRVAFFLEDDNETGSPNLMTPQALKLFDAAVAYALGGATGLHDAAGRETRGAGAAGGNAAVDALGRQRERAAGAPSAGRPSQHGQSGRVAPGRLYSKS